MSALAFYRRLRDAGVDEQTAMLCAQAFEEEVKIAVDAVLEPRRAKDRERKRPRNSTETAEIHGTPQNSEESAETLSLPPSPQTPQPPTHTRVSVTSREAQTREEAGWARFWAAYPRKTAKADARKAYAKAWKKLPPLDEGEIIIGGLERAKAAWTDAQFIPHAATWLNGERWNDEATLEAPNPRKAHERPNPDSKFLARHANYAAAAEGARRVVEASRRSHSDGPATDPFWEDFGS